MSQLPGQRLTYPARTGRQGLDAPPEPEPDRTLIDVLTRSSGLPIRDVALAIQAAGYRRPQPVHNWEELVDYPPAAMLTDGDGRVWTADAVPHELWEKHGPWHVVHTPTIPDITNP